MNKKGNWSHIQKMKGHKSGLETRIDAQLQSKGIDGEYEKHELEYTIPATHHLQMEKYTKVLKPHILNGAKRTDSNGLQKKSHKNG